MSACTKCGSHQAAHWRDKAQNHKELARGYEKRAKSEVNTGLLRPMEFHAGMARAFMEVARRQEDHAHADGQTKRVPHKAWAHSQFGASVGFGAFALHVRERHNRQEGAFLWAIETEPPSYETGTIKKGYESTLEAAQLKAEDVFLAMLAEAVAGYRGHVNDD